MVLFDTDSTDINEVQIFESQSSGMASTPYRIYSVYRSNLDITGVTAISWVSTIPGGFITTDARSGIIRIWNVSQKYVALHSLPTLHYCFVIVRNPLITEAISPSCFKF